MLVALTNCTGGTLRFRMRLACVWYLQFSCAAILGFSVLQKIQEDAQWSSHIRHVSIFQEVPQKQTANIVKTSRLQVHEA